MTPERFKEVERLYHLALEQEPSQRAAFLKSACGDDEGLQKEVESLLAHEGQADNFMEEPALEVAAQGLAPSDIPSLVGRRLGPYDILGLVGAGGMGEVYRARDTRLNRGKPVAYCIWGYVAKPLEACDIQNPVRVDDTGQRDKTWNPGDYVPSRILRFPTLSQFDVLARGNWIFNKWNLEIRRELTTYDKRVFITDSTWTFSNDPIDWHPWPDDLPLVPGHHYAMRVTVYDASSTRGSRSVLLPLYLKPR